MDKIINELRYLDETFPRGALELAASRKDETTALLLKALDEVLELVIIQGVVDDCSLFDMIEDIRFLFDKERVDPTMYGDFEDFLAWMQDDENHRSRVRYIDDVIEEMYWWACFQETEEENIAPLAFDQPIVRPKKVGRNDPCPCGSGKRYKKCCGA